MMQSMETNRKSFLLIIIFALLINILLFLLIFDPRCVDKDTKLISNKEIIIELTQTNTPELPSMLPSQFEHPANAITQKSEAPTEPEKDSHPEPPPAPPEELEKNQSQTAQNSLNLDTLEQASLKPEQAQKIIPPDTPPTLKPIARKRGAKPVFNFNQFNQYAEALGSSAFKNYGADRPATEHDQAILLYQERIRQHFHEHWNNYANTTYYHNLNQSQIFLSIAIDKNGYVLKNNSSHNSSNPALLNLLAKVLKYSEPFPAIPTHLKIATFDFKLTIHFAQGKFSSGYRYG